MKALKRILFGILCFIIISSITGCFENGETKSSTNTTNNLTGSSTTNNGQQTKLIDIYTINDTHGQLETNSSSSLSKIGNYIIEKKKENPEGTIILSAGDSFQGTAVSNLNKGRPIVEAMNYIGFDAMTIGNHEFDWEGIDYLSDYKDGNVENGEADFPFLAANIVYNDTQELVPFFEPYTIVTCGNINVGIIGVIDSACKSSITASYVADYDFLDPLETVKKYAKILRGEKNCDVIIVDSHMGSDNNYAYAELTGLEDVNVMINGHTHRYENDIIDGMATIQAGCNSQYVGHVKIEVTLDNDIINPTSKNISIANIDNTNSYLDDLFDYYLTNVPTDSYGKLMTYSKVMFAKFSTAAMCEYFNADYGITNTGGFRTDFTVGQNLTYDDIYQMIPFDNTIVLVTLTGSQLLEYIDNSYLYTEDSFYDNPINDIDATKEYRIAVLNYVFENTTYYDFVSGKDIEYTGIIFRDIVIHELKLWNGEIYVDQGIKTIYNGD